MLCRKLLRYLPPSDQQIIEMANLKRINSKKGNRNKNHEEKKLQTSFKIPKNTDFVLECTRVRPDHLTDLKFYAEYQWIMDFAVCAFIVFITTELYVSHFPTWNR
jgi:hypothetical protein